MITPHKSHSKDGIIKLQRLMIDCCDKPQHSRMHLGSNHCKTGCHRCEYDRFEKILKDPAEEDK